MYGMVQSTFDAFLTINSISTSVGNSDFMFAFFRNACHTNPGADKKYAGSSSYISMHLLPKLSKLPLITVYHSARIDHDTLLTLIC